jgi:AhpD family alkylhydroperoxidase
VTDATSPRIRPGTRTEIGRVNAVTTRALGAATGGRPPNLFTTVAKHRRLYRAWLRFAAALMPGGDLPRAESELVILRVAHNHDCIYEWRHHEHLAQRAGLSAAEVERVRSGPDAPAGAHASPHCSPPPTNCTTSGSWASPPGSG